MQSGVTTEDTERPPTSSFCCCTERFSVRLGDLGDLGGPEGYVYDINSRGWVVGSSTTAELLPSGLGYVEHAFIHDGERMQDLGTLGGLGSIAWSLNEIGDVVGSSLTGEHLPNGNVSVKHASVEWGNSV